LLDMIIIDTLKVYIFFMKCPTMINKSSRTYDPRCYNEER